VDPVGILHYHFDEGRHLRTLSMSSLGLWKTTSYPPILIRNPTDEEVVKLVAGP